MIPWGFMSWRICTKIDLFYRDVRCSLEEEYNDLIIHDIIEHSFDNGFKEKEFFRISSCQRKLFEGLDVKIHPLKLKRMD